MQIFIKPAPFSDPTDLTFTWNIIDFISTEITVQINFENKIMISQQTVLFVDLLIFIFFGR